VQRAEIFQRTPDIRRLRVDQNVLDDGGHELSPLLWRGGDIGAEHAPVWPFSDIIDSRL
jgi:hypothetical protein